MWKRASWAIFQTNRRNSKWVWLQQGHLKKETEGLLMAAQSQSLRTNAVKAKIDRSQTVSLCRMFRQKDETVNHLLSECPKLAQKEYKERHDGLARALHWDLCKQHGFERSDKWYEHTPKKVEDNENFILLWDFSKQTDKKLDHNHPDIVFVDKENKNRLIIDIACPGDRRVDIKQEEKINKYLDLAIEIKELWKMKGVKVVPVVIGVLGTIPKRLEDYLRNINTEIELAALQRTVLLGSARIL